MPYQLYSYHSNRPSWRRDTYTPRGKLYGIELEIENPNGRRAILACLPEVRRCNEFYRPVTETDGSLNHTGVEIVFPPLAAKTLTNKASLFSRSLENLKENGAVASSRTGMHVNVNIADWSRDKAIAFAAVINWVPSKYLTRVGGRRALNHYSQQCRNGWMELARGHYRGSATLRSNRVEVRFPKATLNMTRVKNVLSFLEFVEEYVEHDSVQQALRTELNDSEVYWRQERSSKSITDAFDAWMAVQKGSKARKIRRILKGLDSGES